MKKEWTTIGVSKNTREMMNSLIKDLSELIPLDYAYDDLLNRLMMKFGRAFIQAEVNHYINESELTDEENTILREINEGK